MDCVVNATPRPLYPQERAGTHCAGSWLGPRANLDGCVKSRHPPGFDPRTVQSVSSRYTDIDGLVWWRRKYLVLVGNRTKFLGHPVFNLAIGKVIPLQARYGPEGGHFTPGKDPVPLLQEAGWAPGPVWTGGKSRPHRDSIPDRPARIPTELPGPQPLV